MTNFNVGDRAVVVTKDKRDNANHVNEFLFGKRVKVTHTRYNEPCAHVKGAYHIDVVIDEPGHPRNGYYETINDTNLVKIKKTIIIKIK